MSQVCGCVPAQSGSSLYPQFDPNAQHRVSSSSMEHFPTKFEKNLGNANANRAIIITKF